MFKDIKELQKYLKNTTDLCWLSNYFEKAVSAEAKELFKLDKKQNKDKADKDQCLLDAQEHYLEEINYFLLNSIKPTAMTVMGYRRKPHAWAIADAIKEYKNGNNPNIKT